MEATKNDIELKPTPEYVVSTPEAQVHSPVYDPTKQNYKPIKKSKHTGLYSLQVITRKILLDFNMLGSNVKEILQRKLEYEYEGKCSKEGYIKKNSIRILTYSGGIIESSKVVFHAVFECLICYPVEGMKFKIKVSSITKAGIRGQTNEDDSPVDVFVSRDHHYKSKLESNINFAITRGTLNQKKGINVKHLFLFLLNSLKLLTTTMKCSNCDAKIA